MDWKLLVAVCIPLAAGLVGYGVLQGDVTTHGKAIDGVYARVAALEAAQGKVEGVSERVASGAKLLAEVDDRQKVLEQRLWLMQGTTHCSPEEK